VQKINKAYEDLVGEADPEDKKELLRPMVKFADSLNKAKDSPHSLRSIVGRMQSCKDQLTGLVRSVSK